MKIKYKLIISFCIILFLPIMLSGITIYGFQNLQRRAFMSTYGVSYPGNYSFMNSLQTLNRMTEQDFHDMEKISETSPDSFDKEEYLKGLQEDLGRKRSYLVVIIDGVCRYNGGEENEAILEELAASGSSERSSDQSTYLDSGEEVLVKQIAFSLKDGRNGAAYIVTTTKSIAPELRRLYLDMIFAAVLILTMTAAVLIVWIYSSMINPLRNLQQAAENIKEGNLDFEFLETGADEIGELCGTFEQMRQRLKDNAEEKLHNEQESRALISNIAHDLKTPITSIKGYSEGILDGVANTPEKVERYVRTIYSKANEMQTLIDELTLYSKIDTNRIPYEFAKLNVADYFADCIEEIGLDLDAKGIGLTYFNYAAEDVQIIADPEQLRRVVNNIIGNSVKYMDKTNGKINIRIKDVGDFIQVELEDNARGISQKDLPYIFDRFYRADASRNSATGGSGIGLSIVKKIIEDHGGKIWATSKEGMGTCMYFVIRKFMEGEINE